MHWLGDLSDARLAEEYNRAGHFLAFPAFKKVSASFSWRRWPRARRLWRAHAAAIPEAVRNGILVEPGQRRRPGRSRIGRLYRDRDLRRSLGAAGLRDVESFEMNRVAARFLAEIAKVVLALRAEEREENENTLFELQKT